MNNYAVFLDKWIEKDAQPMYQIAIAPTGRVSGLATTNYPSWHDFSLTLHTVLNLNILEIEKLAAIEDDAWHRGFVLPLNDEIARSLGWAI